MKFDVVIGNPPYQSDTAVIVITCAKFEQAWHPFFTLFDRYWSDCPYPVYMVTDKGTYPGPKIIEIGDDKGFSENLMIALERIQEEKIIYFQEDYFFMDSFETNRIEKYNNYIDQYDIGCIRLAPCPGPNGPPWKTDEDLGIIEKGEQYRVSTQTAIWNKQMLKKLLRAGETGGQFEIHGTRRSKDLNEIFLSVWRYHTPTPYYITGIVRGVWQENAIKFLEEEGIATKHIKRKIL